MDTPSTERRCFGCTLLETFKARSDEQERYGFGETGYVCKETGFEGYVNPERPQCLRGPFLRTHASSNSREGGENG